MTIKKYLKSHKQMSEAFVTAAFLSVSGGLQDAYTYISRGKVFANAQTGNIVLLSQHIFAGDFGSTLHYLIPVIFFALGVAAAELIRQKYQKAERIHWRQLVLLFSFLVAPGAKCINTANIGLAGSDSGNSAAVSGRFPSGSVQSDCQCSGFVFLCHAGPGLPEGEQLCLCQYHVHRQHPKRHGISVCLS